MKKNGEIKIEDGIFKPERRHCRIWKNFEVAIAIPCATQHSSSRFMKCLANLVAFSWNYGLRVYQTATTERVVVDWARNNLAQWITENPNPYTGNKYTHVFWLDDDHVFNPDMACCLARHNLDMVGATYYARVAKHTPVVYIKNPDPEVDKYGHYPLAEPPQEVFECDAIGFGAMLMKADVFAKVPKPWFTIDYRAGEDIAFCVHAKEAGVKVHCDGAYRMAHIGDPVLVDEAFSRQFRKDNPDMFGEMVRVKMMGERG